MKFWKPFALAAAGTLALASAFSALAADKKVVVGYQTDALPSAVAIANGDFAKTTGYQIDFRKFNSGADVVAAIASGDVQVGYVGSSPYAAASSRGLDIQGFYLASISGTDEALVVRNGSGIKSVSDLKGKRLAAAPVSTDHYQLLALIKHQGLTEKDVTVLAIPQPEIVAAYNRGEGSADRGTEKWWRLTYIGIPKALEAQTATVLQLIHEALDAQGTNFKRDIVKAMHIQLTTPTFI